MLILTLYPIAIFCLDNNSFLALEISFNCFYFYFYIRNVKRTHTYIFYPVFLRSNSNNCIFSICLF